MTHSTCWTLLYIHWKEQSQEDSPPTPIGGNKQSTQPVLEPWSSLSTTHTWVLILQLALPWAVPVPLHCSSPQTSWGSSGKQGQQTHTGEGWGMVLCYCNVMRSTESATELCDERTMCLSPLVGKHRQWLATRPTVGGSWCGFCLVIPSPTLCVPFKW